MQLHQLKPIHKQKKKKRIGRGGKKGTYSGQGQKGQRSRAGRKFQPIIRSLIKRYPKLRGHRFESKAKKRTSRSASYNCQTISILNLDILEKKFSSGDKINPRVLLEKKIIRKIKGRMPGIKILGKGKITKRLVIEGCQLSEGAKKKIEKVGGHIYYV